MSCSPVFHRRLFGDGPIPGDEEDLRHHFDHSYDQHSVSPQAIAVGYHEGKNMRYSFTSRSWDLAQREMWRAVAGDAQWLRLILLSRPGLLPLLLRSPRSPSPTLIPRPQCSVSVLESWISSVLGPRSRWGSGIGSLMFTPTVSWSVARDPNGSSSPCSPSVLI